MDEIAVGFLWHMHQPYYKDPVSGEYLMPWVRLHAVRGYHDMIAVLEDFPEVRVTFNLVPSLLAQLRDYTEEGARDTAFSLQNRPVNSLSSEEKLFLLEHCFLCNFQTMVEPWPRFRQLMEKRGDFVDPSTRNDALKQFSQQDLLDLEVLFNLAWLGFTARRDAGIGELIAKGNHFTEDEKRYVLDYQIAIMERLIPLYRQALDDGRIEITTTPFYHPISPLIMNVGHALRSLDTPLPDEPFSHPEDLDEQVRRAVAFHAELFGHKPHGMWPSEGSVCPEMVPLVKAQGIDWMASDEDILFLSLKQQRTGLRLHRPYRVEHEGAFVNMFFRDRALADNIGFVYARNPAQQAVDDVMLHFGNIRRGARAVNHVPFVSVILDGENPWEYYVDGGEAFLRGLYGRLQSTNGIKTARFHDFLEEHPPGETISHLYTGSWINHNFAIWIGHEEDRKGWEYLSRTRRYVASLGEEAHPLAWEEIYIAEGSDWYWWYGDEFSTANDENFDRLFRRHLKNCHELHGDPVPEYLSQSIITPHDVAPYKVPVGFVHPLIDGRISHFYEWRKAGCFDTGGGAASMYRTQTHVDHIYYGFDARHLFMRVDMDELPAGSILRVDILAPVHMRLSFMTDDGEMRLEAIEGGQVVPRGEISEVAAGSVLEFSVPFALIHARPQDRLRFYLTLMREELELERHPSSGLLAFCVPDEGYERMFWHV